MLDLHSHLSPAQSLAPASRTAAVNGSSVDLTNFDGAVVVIDCGAAGGTTPSFTFAVEHADDNGAGSPGTFAAVAAADLDGTAPVVTDTTDDQIYRIGYIGNKRHLRVAITAVSGTSPTLLCGASVVRGYGRKRT